MALENNFEINKVEEVATLTHKDENAFLEGTDIPEATFKDVAKYQNEYLTDAADMAAEHAEKIMSDDSKISKVVLSVPYSSSKRGNAEVIVHRSKETRIPGTDKTVVSSALQVKVKDPASSVSKSHLAKLKKSLTESLIS